MITHYGTETNSVDIYLDNPLMKSGDLADYIDFEEGMVIRQAESSFEEQSIDYQYLSTYSDFSILEVDTKTLPSNISVVYYSK